MIVFQLVLSAMLVAPTLKKPIAGGELHAVLVCVVPQIAVSLRMLVVPQHVQLDISSGWTCQLTFGAILGHAPLRSVAKRGQVVLIVTAEIRDSTGVAASCARLPLATPANAVSRK